MPALSSLAQDETVCEGDPAKIDLIGLLPDKEFSITYSINGGAPITVQNILSDNSGKASFYTENLTESDNGKLLTVLNLTITGPEPNCSNKFIKTVILEVDKAANGGTIQPVPPICENSEPDDLILSGHTGVVTEWQKSSGPGFTTFETINETSTVLSGSSIGILTETTWFRAVVKNGSCGEAYSEPLEVSVNPIPELISDLNPPGICSNTGFYYEHESSVPGTEFIWVREEIPGIESLTNEGSDFPDEVLVNTTSYPIEVVYKYTLTANGCTNTGEVRVTVTQSPYLINEGLAGSICSGTRFSFEPLSNITSGVNYQWTRPADSYGNGQNSGSGDPNEILVNNFDNSITVTYYYTLSAGGCTNPQEYQVSVTVVPAPNVTAEASDELVCQGQKINLFSSSNVLATILPSIILEDNFNVASAVWTKSPTS